MFGRVPCRKSTSMSFHNTPTLFFTPPGPRTTWGRSIEPYPLLITRDDVIALLQYVTSLILFLFNSCTISRGSYMVRYFLRYLRDTVLSSKKRGGVSETSVAAAPYLFFAPPHSSRSSSGYSFSRRFFGRLSFGRFSSEISLTQWIQKQHRTYIVLSQQFARDHQEEDNDLQRPVDSKLSCWWNKSRLSRGRRTAKSSNAPSTLTENCCWWWSKPRLPPTRSPTGLSLNRRDFVFAKERWPPGLGGHMNFWQCCQLWPRLTTLWPCWFCSGLAFFPSTATSAVNTRWAQTRWFGGLYSDWGWEASFTTHVCRHGGRMYYGLLPNNRYIFTRKAVFSLRQPASPGLLFLL